MKKARAYQSLLFVLFISLSFGCSSAKKKKTPELSELRGKKIALVEVDGERTSRKIVEVALVNQLVKKGTFILVSKQDVANAKKHPKQDPRDLDGIATRAGAEYSLRAKVLAFDAKTNEGYSSEEVEDSVLAEERGEDEAKTKRYFKVKSLTGRVEVDLSFTNLKDQSVRSAIASREKEVVGEARSSAIHLPPVLRFLEDLTNEAFEDFFEKYD